MTADAIAKEAAEEKPRSMRVRIQDMGREFRIMDGTAYWACPFLSHTLFEKWWNEGFEGKTSR